MRVVSHNLIPLLYQGLHQLIRQFRCIVRLHHQLNLYLAAIKSLCGCNGPRWIIPVIFWTFRHSILPFACVTLPHANWAVSRYAKQIRLTASFPCGTGECAMESNVTAELVRALFSYDAETGIVCRRTQHQRYPAGTIVGSKNGNGYFQIGILGRRYPLQRIIYLHVTGYWPRNLIDHINGNRTDNRWCNLRDATHSQNGANSRVLANNTSGFKGVFFHRGKWVAAIKQKDRRVHIGCFDTREGAAAAYAAKARELFGDFARLT